MTGQTVILRGGSQRLLAVDLIKRAPVDAVVNIREATRNREQNARLWAMLSDVSRAKPEGRMQTPDVWKALMMHACGHAVQFETGIDGDPFPIGFRSSRLAVSQMAELITFVGEYGDRHGVAWSDPVRELA